jgi:H+/Cl- antiporter ClcA
MVTAQSADITARNTNMPPQPLFHFARYAARIFALTILIGCVAGLGGMSLAMLLHWVQHLAYGYSPLAIISPESFLQGVSEATPSRRLAVLAVCGLVAGFGWAGLSRYGRPLMSVSAAVGKDAARMPFGETIAHGLLQIVTVALGSPLGREVAPREYGALLAQRICYLFGSSEEEARILVACGSGAGLAAVYNVPLAASIFVVEVLLKRLDFKVLLAATLTCFVAARVAALGLGREVQYPLPSFHAGQSLLLLAMIAGPALGALGFLFKKWTDRCSAHAATGARQIIASLIAFLIVGALSMGLPQLLGNGKGPAEMAFSDHLTVGLTLILVIAKLVSITIVLLAGARGGLLTPGFSLGALVAVFIGFLWNQWLPIVDLGAVAVTGAAAFLSCSMAMPLTAIFITIELTGAPLSLYLPVTIAVLGATAIWHVLPKLFAT